ncbi:MAG: GDSL-type esterase/lipase family protein [Opitutaceae bacterium]|jgi:lysophospholipase L1-like esterase|nr:GDSL-type esterase/lipase family protein [Opitutaceae bacterium]
MISTKPLTRLALVCTLLLTGSVGHSARTSGDSAKPNPAVVPATRNTWITTHQRLNATARKEGCDVMFLGDSITFGWQGNGKSLWDERYAPLTAANFGLGGDKTEHVLWRLQNGALGGGISPKVVVLMIGTNNTGRDSADQIAEGIAAIVQEIGKRSPRSRVLLLDIFPRSEKPDDFRRTKIAAVNAIIAKLDDGQRVFFLPVGQKFVQPDGTLDRKAFRPDFVHLSATGYKIWADVMDARLGELLKTK